MVTGKTVGTVDSHGWRCAGIVALLNAAFDGARSSTAIDARGDRGSDRPSSSSSTAQGRSRPHVRRAHGAIHGMLAVDPLSRGIGRLMMAAVARRAIAAAH